MAQEPSKAGSTIGMLAGATGAGMLGGFGPAFGTGVANSLFGGASSPQVTNQKTNVNEQKDETTTLLQSLQELLASNTVTNQQQLVNKNTAQNTTGTQVTQNMSSHQIGQMNEALQVLMNQLQKPDPYSQQNADAASAGAATAALNQVINTGIGNVAAQGSNFGAYGGTVQGKLASQLGADAAAAGQKVTMDARAQFANASNQRIAALNQALSGLLGNAASQGSTVTNQSQVTGNEASANNLTGTESSTGSKTSSVDSSTNIKSDNTTSTEVDNSYKDFGKNGLLSGLF